jgi:dTDP-4-amino-4,6-dideoxygalactose transaminase
VSVDIPLVDLLPMHAPLFAEMVAAFERVLTSQKFIEGPDVQELESEVATYCGTGFAVGVSSGTDALLAALMAVGVGPGDEVITTPYTFFATAGSIARLGARPVFVDVEPGALNIDASLVAQRITSRTKAILPVHLFGQCADMDAICDVAGQSGVAVIEDAAQAIGAEYRGKRAGSIGSLGCFSFFPSKNLGGLGDGGMVTTNDGELAKKVRMLGRHGSQNKYEHEMLGGNFRLDTIQAAILRLKLRMLDEWVVERQSVASRYDALLAKANLPIKALDKTSGANRHVYNQYVILSPRRDEIVASLRFNRIGSAVYYPKPLHLQECFRYLGHSEGDFPIAEQASRESVALPMFPGIADEQIRTVVSAIASSLP